LSPIASHPIANVRQAPAATSPRDVRTASPGRFRLAPWRPDIGADRLDVDASSGQPVRARGASVILKDMNIFNNCGLEKANPLKALNWNLRNECR
jgi:hypothetical protein